MSSSVRSWNNALELAMVRTWKGLWMEFRKIAGRADRIDRPASADDV